MTSGLPDYSPPPRHYAPGRFGIECITLTRLMNFSAGNAVKYLWRFREKGGTDDLIKARDYLGWLAADVARGAGVFLGHDEKVAGSLLISQWIKPRVVESDIEWAIILVAEGQIPQALEMVTAAIGVRP